jgi:hypothetical protein
VLRAPGSMRVDEKIGVDRDHDFALIQSWREERSATSKPGGSPPGATTHRIFRETRRPRLLAEEAASSRRSPRSINTRRGVRESTARLFARMSRSSGRSTVVFIQETINPYSHIPIFVKTNRIRALSSCGRVERGSPPSRSRGRAASA